MFGAATTEYHSIYLTGITVLVLLYLSYRWWRSEVRIKNILKVIVISVVGFIFYKLVIYIITGFSFLIYTARDHFYSETQDAVIIDFKTVRNKASKGSLTYPVVRYKNQKGDGKVATVDSGFTGSDIPKLNETVKVVVDKTNNQVRLVTYLKTMTIVGWLIFIFFGIFILTGIVEYALSLHLENTQVFIIAGSTFILIPVMILGMAFYYCQSAYNDYTCHYFSRSFWIHAGITGGCLLFMVGYLNILREQYQKKVKKKVRK